MKKILYLIGHLKPGGAETLVKDYALNLDKNKFEVIIITVEQSYNSTYEQILLENNIRIYFLGDCTKNSKKKDMVSRGLDKLKRIMFFKKIVRNEKPDIIHTHLATNEYVSFINTSEIKLYHTIHSEVSVAFREEEKIRRLATSYCVNKKKMTLITINRKMYEDASQLFNTDNCITLHNGIDLERFKSVTEDVLGLKEKYNIPPNSFIIGHVGRFEEVKNHLFLIEIFKKILEEKSNSILLLVGNGRMKDKVKQKVLNYNLEENVIFIETSNKIEELMKVMDVFVFPSKHEGFGLVLLEAQATNIKCVASDTIPQVVNQTNLISFLSLSSEVSEWRDEILKPRPKEVFDYGLQSFDIKQIIKKLENIYLST